MAEKMYKVKKADGGIELMTYEELCHKLGYDPEVQFVEVTTAGTISFSVGRPAEIAGLAKAVEENGYVMSARFRDTCRREFGW